MGVTQSNQAPSRSFIGCAIAFFLIAELIGFIAFFLIASMERAADEPIATTIASFLIPIVFIGLGIVGMSLFLWKSRSRRQASISQRGIGRQQAAPEIQPASEDRAKLQTSASFSSAPFGHGLVLKPDVHPWTKVIGAGLFALFWNGIISVFIYDIGKSFVRGEGDWGGALFMIPFGLVGLALLVLTTYFAFALFNPRPIISINREILRLGETITVSWRLTGSTHTIKKLCLSLKGEEVVHYRRGTDTVTDRSTFSSIPIRTALFQPEIVSGSATITLPADSVPSFYASNNQIVWSLTMQGEIPNWPDIDESFTLKILPAINKAQRGGFNE